MVQVFNYVRFSSSRQERGDSKRRQKSSAVAYAKQHNLQIDNRRFEDLGVSSYCDSAQAS